jgi:hypothetical protein
VSAKDSLDTFPRGWSKIVKRCDECILKTLSLVERMMELADEGDDVREDAGCGVLYGVLRDSAFKIRKLAEAEVAAHVKKGWWDNQTEGG